MYREYRLKSAGSVAAGNPPLTPPNTAVSASGWTSDSTDPSDGDQQQPVSKFHPRRGTADGGDGHIEDVENCDDATSFDDGFSRGSLRYIDEIDGGTGDGCAGEDRTSSSALDQERQLTVGDPSILPNASVRSVAAVAGPLRPETKAGDRASGKTAESNRGFEYVRDVPEILTRAAEEIQRLETEEKTDRRLHHGESDASGTSLVMGKKYAVSPSRPRSRRENTMEKGDDETPTPSTNTLRSSSAAGVKDNSRSVSPSLTSHK